MALSRPTASRILGSHLSLAIAIPSTEHLAAEGGDCKCPWQGGCSNGTQSLCGVVEISGEMQSGDGLHKSVNILNATELHTYKWLKKSVKFLCLCYHNENKKYGCFFEYQEGL